MKFSLTAALLVCAPLIQAAQFTSGQAARAEIGQLLFSAESSTPNQQTVGAMSGLAYDPIHRLLYVADDNKFGATPGNNRVLVFDTNNLPNPYADLTTGANGNPACGVCGYTFSSVLGQVDFNSNVPGLSQSAASAAGGSMFHPTGVATDGNVLAVSDTDNNRVLIWKTVPTSLNAPADIVLGQTDFVSRQPATTTASAMRGPTGLWIQGSRLFVADTTSNRVLIWNSIPTTNNQPADVVVGAPNFDTPPTNGVNATTTAANLLDTPTSVSSDGVHMFVADLANSRVLIWNTIPTQNGQPADVVIGQGNMQDKIVNNSPGLCGTTATDAAGALIFSPCEKVVNFPRFVLSDGTRLFIADSGNNRILVYNTIPTGNGAVADEVLGQPDFTSDLITSQVQSITTTVDNTGSVDTMPTPTSLAYDGTNLYVGDPFNRRVMVFTPGDILLGQRAVLNAASKITRQEGFVTLSLATGGTITANDTVTITIAGTAYTYTIVSGDTLDTITTKLIAQINASNSNAGDPNVYTLPGSIADTIFFDSKGTNLAFDAISLAATTSNPANVVATASGSYLTGGNAGTAAVGTIVEVDNPGGLDANGAPTSQAFATSSASADPTTTLPTTLNGVQVFMDGIPVPVLTAGPAQVTAQVPFQFGDRNSATVTVRARGGSLITSAAPLIIAPAAPGLFGTGTTEPRAAFNAIHQAGNPSSTVSVDGTIQAGDVATITVRSRPYAYTVQASDTLLSVVTALVAKINAATDPEVTASVGGAFNRVIITARQPGSGGSGVPVSGTVAAAAGQSSAALILTAYTSATCCSSSGTGAVTAANPAVANETITFAATGLGAIQDPSGNVLNPSTGVPYNGPQPNSAINSVSATVNGVTGQVTSAGIAQGGNGVYSVDIIMPSSLPTSGVAPVYIAQNAFISNTVTVPVGATTSTTVLVAIDTPNVSSASVTGNVTVAGWALDTAGTITNVAVLVDGVFKQNATYGIARGDVCAVYSTAPQCGTSGFTTTFDASTLSPGTHVIQTQATSSTGASTAAVTTVKVTNPVRVGLDAPAAGSSVAGTLGVGGWAISDDAAITQVTIAIDGTVLQTASYGSPRPDVCSVYPGRAGCNNVGFTGSIDTTQLSNGTHTLIVTAAASDGRHGTASEQVNVSNATAGITQGIDTPGGGISSFLGTVNFRGWAISSAGAISAIRVSIDGVPSGAATYGTARPDVCSAYGSAAGCPNVGWTFPVDTTRLASGPHTLAVTAVSAAGQSTSSATFTAGNGTTADPIVVNADAPFLGQTVSGTFALNGWAISNDTSIASVALLVDGVSFGNATYGASRPDVCGTYPGRAGCPNVGWTGSIDTTLLPDGQHTLAVTATTAAGQSSTYSEIFFVANAAANTVHVGVDSPQTSNGSISGTFTANGWALSSDSSISSVTVKVDGTVLGNANYGAARGDVCSVYGSVGGCPNVGWTYSLDLTQFAPGTHTFEATATSASGKNGSYATSFTVAASPSPIVVDIDRPGSTGSHFLGAATFSGWVGSTAGAINSVAISIDGVPYGPATYGTARPDICAGSSYVNCPNVGWTFDVDTTKLTVGTHALQVLATSGSLRHATSANFVVENWTQPSAVLINVDNPAPNGGPIGGSTIFNGWIISDDGGVASVSVAIDGVPYGNATYGTFRPDVCAAYGRSGSCNYGWTFPIDTSTLNDGTHTLSVTMTNTGGRSTTATRTFAVQNYFQ